MKAGKLIIIVSALFVCMNLNGHSQTDSSIIFYTKDCSISYISGFEERCDSLSKVSQEIPIKTTMKNIREIRFMNDSTMEISDKNNVKTKLKLNGINKIKFYKSSSVWKGMVKGAGDGAKFAAGLGFLLAYWTHDTTSHDYSAFLGFPLVLAPFGAIAGFIWGAFHPYAEYYKYNISGIKTNKKDELIRILKKHSIK